MNVKLTEQEYQHMIIELLAISLDNINDILMNDDDNYVDWIYFLERLKIKGVKSDLRPIRNNINSKSRQLARKIHQIYDNDNIQKEITTMI